MRQFLIFILTLFFSLSSMAQITHDVVGKWQVRYSHEGDSSLIFIKYQPNKNEFREWGNFFEFKSDGTYMEYASAPCGLDDNHYRYSGKWSYNKESQTLQLDSITVQNDRPNIYKNYEVLNSGSLKITSLNKKEIKAMIVTPWEKTSEKKQDEQ